MRLSPNSFLLLTFLTTTSLMSNKEKKLAGIFIRISLNLWIRNFLFFLSRINLVPSPYKQTPSRKE